jgi:hypothetical protein
MDFPTRGAAELRQEQMKDEELRKIIKCFEDHEQKENICYWTNKGYLMTNGVLYRYSPEAEEEDAQLVVPEHEWPEILKIYHDAPTPGHYGIDRTIHRIASRYFWRNMRTYITNYIRKCIECQRYKASNLKPAGLLQTSVMNQRFETIAFDLFGPLPKSEDNKIWILIVEDVASRWVELFPLEHATATECAETLINEIFMRYGTPRRVISDNGTQFVSAVMQKMTFCLDIKHSLTPYYHPEGNPVERKNRDLKTQLAILVEKNHRDWPKTLPAIRFAMNTAHCESTGHSAAYLTYGRELRSPDDVHRDLKSIVCSENFVPEITPRLIQLAETLRRARNHNDRQKDKQKEYCDRKRRPDPSYKPGDLVLVNTHSLSNAQRGYSSKFAPRRDGPYVILRKHGPASYEVATSGETSVPVGIYHTSELTPFHGADTNLPDPVQTIRKRGRPRKNLTKIQPKRKKVNTLSPPPVTERRRSTRRRGQNNTTKNSN